MDSGRREPEPSAGPVESEKEAATFLRQALKEAQVQVELWKEQAEQARKENLQFQIQLKSSVEVHQVELDSFQKQLAQTREEHERQGKLVKKLRAEIDSKDKLLRNCQKALTQVTVSIEQNLTETECKDQLSKEEVEEVSSKSSSSHESASDDRVRLPAEGGQRWGQELGKDEEACRLPGEFTVGKKAKAMEASAFHYQELHLQEHSQQIGTDNQARALEMECNSARRHIDMQNEELKSVRTELATVKQQLSDVINLAESRGKELKGSQVGSAKTSLSVTDVVQKVNALNLEIFQLAAFFGEVFVYGVLEPEAYRQEHKQVIASVYLGESLANTLAQHSLIEPKEKNNPLLVQIIMQIALTSWCAVLSRRWTAYRKVDEPAGETGGQPKESSRQSLLKQADHNRFVSELYDDIRDHEDETVAIHWRSLTRAHLPFSTSGWDQHLMVAICSIMGVAGWATRSNEDMAQIKNRLDSIFKPLLDLRKATGEDMTSADLDISFIQSGRIFDPSYMEDAYTDGRSSSKSKKSAPEPVINTSGLGLQKIVVKRLKGGGVQRHAEILSKPKVVLEKTIKEALEPPPPTRRKKKKKVTATDAGGGSTGLLGSLFG